MVKLCGSQRHRKHCSDMGNSRQQSRKVKVGGDINDVNVVFGGRCLVISDCVAQDTTVVCSCRARCGGVNY